eukprot:Opistho-1_new@41559
MSTDLSALVLALCVACVIGAATGMGLFDWVSNMFSGGSAKARRSEPMVHKKLVGINDMLIWTEKSSQFLDSDGDAANEFFEEVPGGLRKISRSQLRPEGTVKLDHPRLSPLYPSVFFVVQPETGRQSGTATPASMSPTPSAGSPAQTKTAHRRRKGNKH